jgi:electron transfer flavoprotein alpha subunit/NAD-dependent dihydropyrimidine dehydrogenase PreA subunit
MLIINYEDCNGCKLCLKNCPFGALIYEDGRIQVTDLCSLCGSCANVCRKNAIHIERKQASPQELAQYKAVFIWIEFEEHESRLTPRKVAYELLGKGRYLADQLNQELVAVALGDDRLSGLDTLAHFGADRVIVCQHELLSNYSTDGFTNVLCALIAQKKPSIVLYGATPHGRDFAPRVAARLKLGLTADCTGLDIDDEGQLVQTRPAFGGNIMASIVTPYSRPQTATVRPNVFNACVADHSREAVVENFSVTLTKAAIRTRVVESKLLIGENEESIEDARVIVAGGRGCQKAANLEILREVAAQLGGVLAGTRAIVEQGWIPHTLQVGQSGMTVGPDLYIAVGVSGAIQHIVGMSSSKTIIAINKDPDAPIFKTADLGIVGDGLEILLILNELIRKEKSSSSASK